MDGSLLDGIHYVLQCVPSEDLERTALTIPRLERAVLYETLYGECRGEPRQGQIAVASVIRNRAQSSIRWWGVGWLGVCLAPWQFSHFNAFTVQDDAHTNVNAFLNFLRRPDRDYVAGLDWVTDGALSNYLEDPTDGADHYHTTAVSPSWMTEKAVTCRIGAHVFYR
tara:strand:- start:1156 stop:1656 length:501 start_codon:yes stop_codon:yes gene_type:complete